MRRREPAMPLLVQDLLMSVEEELSEEDGPRSHHITPTGAGVYRALISGVLMEMDDIGSEGSPLIRLRLADPTGGISFTIGRFNPGLIEIVKGLEVPSFVTVVGKVTRFISKRGNSIVTINPEIIVPATKEDKDSWNLLAVRDTLSRLWRLEGRGPLPLKGSNTIRPQEPRGGEEVVEATMKMVKDTLLTLDRSRFLKEMEMLKDRPAAPVDGSGGDLEQYEDQVVNLINGLDSGDGARWDELVDAVEQKRLSREIIEEVISNLLDKGLLYEPVLGYLKAV
jgi:hypothetical protein